MKKYIFITPTINDMGGAQMYLRNKLVYLKSQGWEVLFFTAAKSRSVIIPELKAYTGNCFPELAYNCYEYPRRKVEKTVKAIISKIHRDDGVVFIESTCLSEATWGEYIAKELSAKHLFYTLQESNLVFNKGMEHFLVFKHKRREIAGIAPTSLLQMFKPFYEINEDASYRLSAACTNVEADVECAFVKQVKNKHKDRTVGCLSRLDKPFVEQGVRGVVEYCNIHPEHRILLLLIGGAPNSHFVKEINNITSQAANLETLITGYIYPLPIKLLDTCDVFFSSAGSARVCMRSGIPTIAFDSNDSKPIGVLGKTTSNSLFRQEEETLDFVKLLEEVLDEQKYKKEDDCYIRKTPDYSKHLKFMDQSEQKVEYFDILSIRITDRKEKIRNLLLTLFGAKFYDWMGSMKEKITSVI